MQDDVAKVFAGEDFQDALRFAEKVTDYGGPDDPRPLIYTTTHLIALGVFIERLRNKPRKGGRPPQWNAEAHLQLWAEVQHLAFKGMTDHGACHWIAKNPSRWQKYPLTPNDAQTPDKRGETLHRRYLLAKEKGSELINGSSPAHDLARALIAHK